MTERSGSRLFVMAVLVMSLIVTLAVRAFSLQVVQSRELTQAALDNRVRQAVEPAVRGLVLDQTGRVLAGNRVTLEVTASRRVLRKTSVAAASMQELGRLLAADEGTLAARLRNCGTPGARKRPDCWNGAAGADPVVARDLSVEQAAAIVEQPRRFPGLTVTRTPVREYPYKSLAAQVLGYTAAVSAADLAADPDLAGVGEVGRSGLEGQYDTALRGVPGRSTTAVDSAGHRVTTTDATAAVPGQTLVTAIDAKLQRAAEAQLRAAMERTRGRIDRVTGKPFRADTGAAVVLDVKTGRVLALVSLPDYDANIWVGGIGSADYQKLTSDDSGHPLLSRGIQAAAPPASTFKTVTTAAALQNGFSSSAYYPCSASYEAGGRRFTNYESKAHGWIDFRRSLEVSCDTVFYRVADRLWQEDGGATPPTQPKDAISNMASAFGFGRATGIDLPGEVAGRVASRADKAGTWSQQHETWCRRARTGYPEVSDRKRAKYLLALARENCSEGMLWRVGDAVNAAIGQGDTTVTPLQLAVAYAAIASGGTLWRPHVAKALLAPDGTLAREFTPTVAGTLPVPPQDLAYLRAALRGVVDQGTARKLFRGFPTIAVPIAGKTGTAEVYGQQTTSWFASFAPATDPQYAVVAMVTNAGTGAGTAGRAVKGIYEALFGVRAGVADSSRSVLAGGAPATTLPQVSDGIPAGLAGAR